jgi:cobalt-zinc-cadmium efflux system protein
MPHHHHEDLREASDRRLFLAVAVNVLLTVAQVAGGLVSGSLALIADALHNLGDAAALGIAVVARKIGRRPANHFKTFGYKRAEVIAALVNLTTLAIIGLYLVFEALWRFVQPQEIHGWIVVVIAGVALVVNTVTAVLTYSLSRVSINVRAAFMHNLSDALASLAVIVAGVLILLFRWYWVDAFLTLVIAGYVLYQAFSMLPETVHILMQGTPAHISIDRIIQTMESLDKVESVHHVHVWQLDEYRNALEAHVVISDQNLMHIEAIKQRIRDSLSAEFGINHSTLEIEVPKSECQG